MTTATAYVRNADTLAQILTTAPAADIAAVLRDVQVGRLIIADADARVATSLRDVIMGEIPATQTNREGVALAIAYAVVSYLQTPGGRSLARDSNSLNDARVKAGEEN